jgi:hypothetical protein
MLEAARQNLGVGNDGWAGPDFLHPPMVSFPAGDDKAFCRLAEKIGFV